MNNYPTLAQMVGSSMTPMFDVAIDRAVNGAPKLRSFYDSSKMVIHVVHWLTQAQLNTLMSYYNNAANKTTTNSFTWAADNTNYTVHFAGPPRATWGEAGYTVEVDLVEA